MPGFGESFSKFANSTKKQAQVLLETNKLNAAIHKEESAIETTYTQIGKAYFETYLQDRGIPANFRQMLDDIQAHLQQIEDLKAKIEEVKGTKKCPGCGVELENETPFCSKCGYRFETQPAPMPVPETAAPVYPGATYQMPEIMPAPIPQDPTPPAVEIEAPALATGLQMKNCSACGKTLTGSGLFCTNCGQKQE